MDSSILPYQVRERAYEIWGGEEGLEIEHQKRSELKEKKKEKKYAKEIKGECMHVFGRTLTG